MEKKLIERRRKKLTDFGKSILIQKGHDSSGLLI